LLFEPTIPSNENGLIISKKRKSKSSTRHDHSQFEITEAQWHYGPSNRVTKYEQNIQNISPTNSEFEIPTIIDNDDVFDWIDSNM
jgi:hypothetical protein